MVWQKNYGAPGTAPGTLVPPPDAVPHVLVTAVHYTAEDHTETQVTEAGYAYNNYEKNAWRLRGRSTTASIILT